MKITKDLSLEPVCITANEETKEINGVYESYEEAAKEHEADEIKVAFVVTKVEDGMTPDRLDDIYMSAEEAIKAAIN